MAHDKAKAKLLASAKRRRTKRKKAASILAPTDKEIAKRIEDIAKFWLTTPGLPVSMTDKSPLWEPLFGSPTTSVVEGTPLTQTPWIPPGTVVPESIRQAIRDFEFPKSTGGKRLQRTYPEGGPFVPTKPGPTEDGAFFTEEAAAGWDYKALTSPSIRRARSRTRSKSQMMTDSILSDCLKRINKRARKKNGSFKKGWSQKRIMKTAQRECKNERQRLGLTKRKRKRGSSSR